jgi:predicted DNA binding protein
MNDKSDRGIQVRLRLSHRDCTTGLTTGHSTCILSLVSVCAEQARMAGRGGGGGTVTQLPMMDRTKRFFSITVGQVCSTGGGVRVSSVSPCTQGRGILYKESIT